MSTVVWAAVAVAVAAGACRGRPLESDRDGAAGIGGLGGGQGGGPGGAQGGGPGQDDAAVPDANSSVFSAIDVRIVVSGYDAIDPNARDPVTGAYPVEPPIVVSVSARVEINGGTSAGRVPGLRVFGDGKEVAEVGSAGSPPKFDFQYRPSSNLVHGRSMELELQYQGSTVSFRVAPPVVDISSPGAEQAVPANQTLVLRWTGVETPPVQAYISPRGPSCTTSFRASPGDTTTFVPRAETGPGRQEPPCRFELSADWHIEDGPSPTELRSLRIERDTRRIQRFTAR